MNNIGTIPAPRHSVYFIRSTELLEKCLKQVKLCTTADFVGSLVFKPTLQLGQLLRQLDAFYGCPTFLRGNGVGQLLFGCLARHPNACRYCCLLVGPECPDLCLSGLCCVALGSLDRAFGLALHGSALKDKLIA